jgi:hypothetical protein
MHYVKHLCVDCIITIIIIVVIIIIIIIASRLLISKCQFPSLLQTWAARSS